MGEFSDKVFTVVRQIPRGKVATYGQIATMIGSPRSARYVGFALRNNPAPGTGEGCNPCHRVVFGDGKVTNGFAFGGPGVQRDLLLEEGVVFKSMGDADNPARVDLKVCQWDGRPPEDAVEGHPTAPPADFDWAAELGED